MNDCCKEKAPRRARWIILLALATLVAVGAILGGWHEHGAAGAVQKG